MKAKEVIAHLSADPEANVYFHNMDQSGSSHLPVDWVNKQKDLPHLNKDIKDGDFLIGCD